MIVVLFGQPHSGKTTLGVTVAKHLMLEKRNWTKAVHHIDGDELRKIFNNTDYSKEGRIKNLNRASEIATYLNNQELDVVISLMYPYEEAREYLNQLSSDVKWFYLHYTDVRGRENFHVEDFELDLLKEDVLTINTTDNSINDCLLYIVNNLN